VTLARQLNAAMMDKMGVDVLTGLGWALWYGFVQRVETMLSRDFKPAYEHSCSENEYEYSFLPHIVRNRTESAVAAPNP